jgi:hypothetical protein
MPIHEQQWFDSAEVLQADGTRVWQEAVFSRAFCGQMGPFTRVCQRLRAGFSVLVYLPGNCMSAAADHVKRAVTSGQWKEYGEHPGKGSLADTWKAAGGIVEDLSAWLKGEGAANPHAIYHNLDLLGDGRGGVFGMIEAQTALFSIIEGTRKGVVLGLADSTAGRLPERLEGAFGETVWLTEIPRESFGFLVPVALADRIAVGDRGDRQIPDGAAWLLTSRLRWTDPIRAVNIMVNAAEAGDWPAILDALWKATRSIDFEDPGAKPDEITGVPDDTLDRLRRQIVLPFRQWLEFSGSPDEGESQLKRLVPGVVLYGPPGTGKTYLASWMARSLQLPVRVVSGTDIKAGLWGDAEKNIRRIFEEARRASPCVLVFDDADDLFPDRGQVQGSLAGAERGVVDAALQQLDGFAGRPSGVFVILTTNRLDAVDAAIRRRLKLKERIPYPLTPEQIEQLVRAVSGDYRYDLDSDILERLTTRFLGPVAYGAVGPHPTEPDERRGVDDNLFSPSEIQLAMQLLEDLEKPENYHDGRYTPDAADVDRMERYYAQLPPPAPL